MYHIISFRRPELRHVLSKMTVPPEADVAAQIRRLQDLGYQIVDVTPPGDGYGPDYQNVDVVSPTHEGRSAKLRSDRSTLHLGHKTSSLPRKPSNAE